MGSGVYDIGEHYWYESRRGVHEISGMKGANGGHPSYFPLFSPTTLLPLIVPFPSPLPSSLPLSLTDRDRDDDIDGDGDRGRHRDKNRDGDRDRGLGLQRHPYVDLSHLHLVEREEEEEDEEKDYSSSSSSSFSSSSIQFSFPKTLLLHGIEDETVPFTNSYAFSSLLLRYEIPVMRVWLPKTDHFGPIGDLMFQHHSPPLP